jgi:hypothetical protein
LTNNNTLYLDYILENYSSFERSKLVDYKNDIVRLKEVFIEELKKDSYFQKNVNPPVLVFELKAAFRFR